MEQIYNQIIKVSNDLCYDWSKDRKGSLIHDCSGLRSFAKEVTVEQKFEELSKFISFCSWEDGEPSRTAVSLSWSYQMQNFSMR